MIMRSVRKIWRVAHGLGWYNFYGSWPTLADVPATRGVDSDEDPWARAIAADWQVNLDKGGAPICDDTGRLILPVLASQFTGPLTVLDFGGGAGIGLANILKFARPDLSRLSYVLVETPAMCRTVRRQIEAHSFGTVTGQIPHALPAPLIVNASSSIQYIADYQATLSSLARLAPEFFIISQTPLTGGPTCACQVLNTPHRKIASWVFNRGEFVDTLRSLGYRLTFSVDHDLPLTYGNASGPWAIASMIFVPARQSN
jgi:putative methyltransferase (TIGR04325 family)